MSRGSMVLLVSSILLASTGAGAETFGGWRYTTPKGFTSETFNDHVALTKTSGGSFCSISIFEARPLEQAVSVELAYEWYNTVTHSFIAKVKERGSMTTKNGSVATTTATVTDDNSQRYAASHYILTPPGMIGSVLVLADTDAALARCRGAALGVVRSLEIDKTSSRGTDPEARVESPQGRWTSLGATTREYTFASDGTYRFHSETTEGAIRVVNENGTYVVIGDQVTLTSAKKTKTTFTWAKRYVPETNEWRMTLTAKKPSASFEYSDKANATWKFPPAQPGV